MSGDESGAAKERVASLLELGRWDEAGRLLATLLASAPDDGDLLLLLARANLGADRAGEALTAAEAACAAGPENPFAHYWRTMALVALGSRAIEAAQRTVELAPNLPSAWFAMTRAELARHNTPRALAAAERLLELAPASPIGHHAMGLVHLERREWSDAEQDYRAALKLAPTSPIYINNLGLAMLRQGKTKDAAEHFVRAGETDPGDAELYRRNAATAGEAYIQMPHARLRREAGLAIGGGILLLVIVFSNAGPTFGIATLAALVTAAIVMDRIRMRRLPAAARTAVQSRRREKRDAWRTPRRWTARQWRLVVAVCAIAGISVAVGLAGRSGPGPAAPPDTSANATVCAAARAGLITDAHGNPVTAAQLGCPAD